MLAYKKILLFTAPVLMLSLSCTKLEEDLGSTLTAAETTAALGSNGTGLLLNAAYSDLAGPYTSQDLVFSLQENSTDESLVPTRGGDWDDNGVWRVLQNHTWNADHGQILSVFNNLNKINFDSFIRKKLLIIALKKITSFILKYGRGKNLQAGKTCVKKRHV